MKRKWKNYVVSLLLCTLVTAEMVLKETVQGATLDVCPIQCTYSTIQSAVDVADNGDIISVGGGTYYENIRINGLNNISIIGSGIGRSIIDGGGNRGVINANAINANITIHIEGFTITNGGNIGSGWAGGVVVNGQGPCCSQVVNAVIEKCEITNNYGTGVNIVNDNRGISYIENNIISNNTGAGFDRYLGTYFLRHNVITGNQDGYYDWSGGGSMTITNNIITGNIRYGIYKHRTTPVSISYNNVWNNGEGSYYEGYSGPSVPFIPEPGTGEISSDPLFVDPDSGDYHLTAVSPCIDAGKDVVVHSDIDGDVRPWGAGYDMGIDEYTTVCGNGLNLSANVWTMFSAPCIPPSGSATVNDQLNGDLGTGAAYDLTWVMFRWNSATESYEQVQATDPLEQGVGYWIYSKQAGTLKIDNGTHTTDGATPVSGEDGYYDDCSDYGWIGQPCYKIDLTPPTLAEGTKWNLIGYPFVRNTDWAAVHVAYSENNGATWLDAGTPSAADTSGYISKNGYVYNNSGSAYNVFDDTVSSPSPGILQPNKSYWIMSRFVSGVTNLALLAPAPSL
ncbi:hypothetical protein GKODMF_04420 [Candidatus Electrothrix gigas]